MARSIDSLPLPGGTPAMATANIDRVIDIDAHSLAIVRRILRRTGDIALARSYIPSCHARATR